MSTYDVTLIDGAVFQANEVASLEGVTNNGNGTYDEDGSTYGGALSDFNSGLPSGNISTVAVNAYNATNAPGVIEFNYTYQDGHTVGPFGGVVIGWDANAVLVENIDDFVPISQSAGTYVGTPDPNNLFWFSTQDISLEANNGNGPTGYNENTGVFSPPVTFVTTGTEPNFTTICFLAGTGILTPQGQVAVETLNAGDDVMLAAGGTARITWVGKGTVLARRGRRGTATPVILRKGSLADNVPNRDLRVTKAHAFHIDGVLIPAEFLVNHRSILWDDRAQEVELYHIELETHGVLVANGAPAESYRDDGNRLLFRNTNSGWNQPPKPPCAPVLTGGPIVDAVWRRLLDRAGPRPGLPLTSDPDLHLLVDGRRVDATEHHGLEYSFRLDARPNDLRIVSRAAAPAELGLARDPRVLGVAVRRIVVREDAGFNALDAADPLLKRGFHAFEQDNGFRWTNGEGVLPTAVFDGFSGPVELVLHLGETMRYMDGGAASIAA